MGDRGEREVFLAFDGVHRSGCGRGRRSEATSQGASHLAYDRDMSAPRPFAIHVPDDVLDDLRARLERVRWPDEIPGAGWRYGSDLA